MRYSHVNSTCTTNTGVDCENNLDKGTELTFKAVLRARPDNKGGQDANDDGKYTSDADALQFQTWVKTALNDIKDTFASLINSEIWKYNSGSPPQNISRNMSAPTEIEWDSPGEQDCPAGGCPKPGPRYNGEKIGRGAPVPGQGKRFRARPRGSKNSRRLAARFGMAMDQLEPNEQLVERTAEQQQTFEAIKESLDFSVTNDDDDPDVAEIRLEADADSGTGGGGSDSCFSGDSLVSTDRGDVPMHSVAVGDLVQAAGGVLQPVLSFIHHGTNSPMQFLKIAHDQGVVELSETHMLHRADGTDIAARDVRVGDLLAGAKGAASVVTAIGTVQKSSWMAPLTQSGTVLTFNINYFFKKLKFNKSL